MPSTHEESMLSHSTHLPVLEFTHPACRHALEYEMGPKSVINTMMLTVLFSRSLALLIERDKIIGPVNGPRTLVAPQQDVNASHVRSLSQLPRLT